MNQCDGCRRGLPLRNGIHYGEGYDLIACTKERYTDFKVINPNDPPDTSWLHGKYPEVDAEINTSLPYVSIDEYFWQGDEAENVIREIHTIWVLSQCNIEEAIARFRSNL